MTEVPLTASVVSQERVEASEGRRVLPGVIAGVPAYSSHQIRFKPRTGLAASKSQASDSFLSPLAICLSVADNRQHLSTTAK